MVWVDNGKIQITLIPTRGMGIQMVTLEGKRILGWDSPVKDVVHPNFINLNSRGGLGWLEGFNEWLCRCGMEWNGRPGPTGSSTARARRRRWTSPCTAGSPTSPPRRSTSSPSASLPTGSPSGAGSTSGCSSGPSSS